jgi:ABC-type Zn uptake system ZnuABC Zn-binding protein ZnuA
MASTPRNHSWLYASALVLLPLFGGGCGGGAASGDAWEGTTKPRVLTSIVPLYCFTAQVAGDDAAVRCLLTARGPHDYQSSPHDAKLLASADLFIVNGFGLEEFLTPLERASGNTKLKVIRAADRIPKERVILASGEPHYHGDKLVVHTGSDPHVWLGIEEAILQVEAIRDALCELEPQREKGYKHRAAACIARLRELKEKYDKLKVPGGLVTFHDSFRYFGRSFNVPIVGTIRDLSGSEVAPARLAAQAIDFRKKGVKLISVEPQYPRNVAENLAREIGDDVRIVELDPLETGKPLEGNRYQVDPELYFKKMTENLEHLSQAAVR